MESIADRLGRLEKAADPGEWWHPHKPHAGDGEPGPDKLAGETLSRSTEEGAYGAREVIRVLTETGEVWRVYNDGTVMERLFAERDPRPGDLVFIAFLGHVTGRGEGKSDYPNWSMAVDKGSHGPDTGSDPSPPMVDPGDAPIDTAGLPDVPGEDEENVPF